MKRVYVVGLTIVAVLVSVVIVVRFMVFPFLFARGEVLLSPVPELMMADKKVEILRQKFPFKPVEGGAVTPERFQKWLTIREGMTLAQRRRKELIETGGLKINKEDVVKPIADAFNKMEAEGMSMEELDWIDQQVIFVIFGDYEKNVPGMSNLEKFADLKLAPKPEALKMTADQKVQVNKMLLENKDKVITILSGVGYGQWELGSE